MFEVAALVASFARLVSAFLRLSITPVKTAPPAGAAEFNGAVMNTGGLVKLFTDVTQNASPSFGNFVFNRIGGAATQVLTAAQMVGGLIARQGQAAAFTDSTDTATNIVNVIPGAVVGQTFLTIIFNQNSGLMTLAAGTGVTLVGSTNINRFSTRLFQGQVLGSAAVTINGCFEFGTTMSPTGMSGA